MFAHIKVPGVYGFIGIVVYSALSRIQCENFKKIYRGTKNGNCNFSILIWRLNVGLMRKFKVYYNRQWYNKYVLD